MDETVNDESKEKIEEVKINDVDEKQKELDELTDRYKRILAEFENYKKRSAKEREILYNSLLSDIITSMLPVLDNLEKATDVETSDGAYKEGINLVLKQFKDVLDSLGVKEIEAVGQSFDPEIHEAVSSIQDDTLGEKEVKEVLRKGYKIGTKVIRHAMVIVAN